MWVKVSGLILRNRIAILIALAVVTCFMGYMGRDVKLSYKFGGILPESDSTYIRYQEFIKTYSEDGNVIVFGVQNENLYKLKHFNAWVELGKKLKNIKVEIPEIDSSGNVISKKVSAIDSIFSIANLYTLTRNDEEKKFELTSIFNQTPDSQNELDEKLRQIKSLPFYRNLLYNEETGASLMMVFANGAVFNSKYREQAIPQIEEIAHSFEQENFKLHISGLPYIRSITASKVKAELGMFVVLAALVTSLLLFFFFRSFRVVLFSVLVVITGVVWSMGIIGLFDFKLSILMGLIPPLMIVIGIPNCVFLLNKYHQEFRLHGNKIKALSRTIQKIGNATFMTNCTTAMGFATFIFTNSPLLEEFGIVASINIMVIFFLSLFLIPIIFSFQPEPKMRHTKHLEKEWLAAVGNWMVRMLENHRKLIYRTTFALLIMGGIGISQIQVTGNIVDDLPSDHPILMDLKFFETHFKGVMPLEMIIDTKKEGGALKSKNIKRVDKLQSMVEEYPEISKSLSLVDGLKFSKQAFYNGLEEKYSLINSSERSFITPYLSNTTGGAGANMLNAFIDSSKQRLRVTAQMADIGTLRMQAIMDDLKPKIDSILPPENYSVELTGTSVVFLKGTRYLVNNLFVSLAIAIVIIATIMALLFSSWRMVVISFVPNLIPLIITAAIMGFTGVPIKPSTILVFSIAFGISVDDTIHFLAKYRQELRVNYWNIGLSVKNAVRETGISMIYTSIILFFGFCVFMASGFGGTQALGILVSITLLVAMLTNLLLLPSLLMSLERYLTTQAFKEPLVVIIDEEEDIDLEELEIQKTRS